MCESFEYVKCLNVCVEYVCLVFECGETMNVEDIKCDWCRMFESKFKFKMSKKLSFNYLIQ